MDTQSNLRPHRYLSIDKDAEVAHDSWWLDNSDSTLNAVDGSWCRREVERQSRSVLLAFNCRRHHATSSRHTGSWNS